MTQEINIADIQKQLDFLGHDLFWFHAFKPAINGEQQKGHLYSEFCLKERVIELCEQLNGHGILAVAINERARDKTKTIDVNKVGILLFDVDVKKELRKQNGFVSTPEQHEHALKKAQIEITPYLKNKDFNVDLIVDSGNGCQLFCKVNIDILTVIQRNNFLEKVTALENDIRRFDDDIISIDFLTKDVNRRVKLAGTINQKDINQKEDRLAKILFLNPNINIEQNNIAFKNVQVPQKTLISIEQKETNDTKINQIINSDVAIQNLLRNKDAIKEFKSRSEAELSLVCKLVSKGITNYEDINRIMREGIIGKWAEAADGYRKLTFNKAKKLVAEDSKKIYDGKDNIAFNFDIHEPTQQIETLDKLKDIIIKNFPTIWFETKACLSTCATLSLKSLNGCPSLNLIGNPSGEKTTVLSFFYGQEFTYISDDFTPRAFVSHSANVKENDLMKVDLLPKIKNKILITPELAPLFESPKDKLLDNFSILTRVLDGEGLNRDSGTHGHRGYSGDYKFIWLGASTPFKGAVWRIMGKIGNRLFFLNMKDKDRTDKDFLDMFRGASYEEKVKGCRGAVRSFLDNFFKMNGIRQLEWVAEQDVHLLPEIIKYAKFLSKLRGSLMLWQSEEDGKYEFSFPIIEEPPRAINLLYNIAKGHALINGRKSLENDDLEIVEAICFSSMPHDRYKFLQLLAKHDGLLTTHQVESELNCSKDTALRTMKILQILDIVSLEEIQVESNGAGSGVGRPVSFIKIKPEFKELLQHTQGRFFAINNKSQKIKGVCVRCNNKTNNPTQTGLCGLCATAIEIISLIHANSDKNDSNAGVSFDTLQQLSELQDIDLEFELKRLQARGEIYEVSRGSWKVLE